MWHSLSLPANDPLQMKAGNQDRAKGLGRRGHGPERSILQGGTPLKPSQHGLCHALHDALCITGLVPGFVVLFHTESWWFPAFQANIGQKEDFEAAQKKALSLGAKKVMMSLPASGGFEFPLLSTMGVNPLERGPCQ